MNQKIDPLSKAFDSLIGTGLTPMFVYGTLMHDFGNNELIPEDARWCEGITTHANFVMKSHGGFPAVAEMVWHPPGKTFNRIRGEVWLVDAETEAKLDGLEGYPGWYEKRVVEVTVIGEAGTVDIHTMMYILNTGRDEVAADAEGVQCWRRHRANQFEGGIRGW